MKVTFNQLGVLTNVDYQGDSLRQGSVGNVLQAIFDQSIDNTENTATFNFTRSDGSRITNVSMVLDSNSSNKYNYAFADPWFFAKDGETTLTIFLHDANGNIVAQGQVLFEIEETDYDDDPETITEEQYDSLLEAIGAYQTLINAKVDIVVELPLGTTVELTDEEYEKLLVQNSVIVRNGEIFFKRNSVSGSIEVQIFDNIVISSNYNITVKTITVRRDKVATYSSISLSPATTVENGNSLPVTSGAVYTALANLPIARSRIIETSDWTGTLSEDDYNFLVANKVTTIIRLTGSYSGSYRYHSEDSTYIYFYNYRFFAETIGAYTILQYNLLRITKSNRSYYIRTSGDFATYSKTQIDSIISTLKSNSFQTVNTTTYPTLADFLETTGEEGYIYLYPVDVSDLTEGYHQYIWENNGWINIGSTNIDLSNYYTKTESDEKYEIVELSVTNGQTLDATTLAKILANPKLYVLKDINGNSYYLSNSNPANEMIIWICCRHYAATTSGVQTLYEDYIDINKITGYVTYHASSKGQYYTPAKVDSLIAGASSYQEITYAELKALRDGGTLVAGRQYRITDYTCTTVQTNTSSAGHVFDIIVTADSTSKLNEKARAILHSGDTYFANSKLEAWELWYSLDNDTTRFAWADTTNGKGVIYRMIDEFGNDCPYDFKNIKFTIDNVSYYTFDVSISGTKTDRSLTGDTSQCYSNVIGEYRDDSQGNILTLNATVFSVSFNSGSLGGYGWVKNIIGNGNRNNMFTDGRNGGVCNNVIGCTFFGNKINGSFKANHIGNSFINNTIGDAFTENHIGDFCQNNNIKTGFTNNTIRNFFSNNIIGTGFTYNNIGAEFYNNDIGNVFMYNVVGTFVRSNITSLYVKYCIFDSGVQYVALTSSDTEASSSNYLQNVHICLGVHGASSANPLTITVPDRNLDYETTYKANNSVEVILQ